MSKIIIISILLLQGILSNCEKGCLKCDNKNICLLCDTQKNYKLDGVTCILYELQNCLKLSQEGKCLQCDKGYYIDPNTYKCVKILNQIPNCVYYSDLQQCKICENNFFVKDGKCSAVFKIIPGCKYYLTSSDCQQCEDDLLMDSTQRECKQQFQIKNCYSFTYYFCEACEQNYHMNQNYYFKTIYKFDDKQQISYLTDYIHKTTSDHLILEKKSICEIKNNQKCLEFDQQMNCLSCQLNYFLGNDLKCHQFPREQIDNCEQYKSAQICSACSQGYFLQSSNKCSPVSIINNCKLYNNSASQSECLECESEFFIQEKKCIKRIESLKIDLCQINNPLKDECQKCKEKFVLTSDFLKCLPEIENCQIYQQTTKNDEKLTCKICQENFYIKNLQCIQGTVSNCHIYDPLQQDTCEVCKNEFYLENKVCQPHQQQSLCKNYSLLKKNICLECMTNSIQVKIVNQCKLSNFVNNCEVYSNATTCNKCKQNFYLYENQCQVIPDKLNCIQYDGENCLKCKEFFVIHQGKCIKIPRVIQENCFKNNTADNNTVNLNQASCQLCEENSIPLNKQNSFICYENIFQEKQIENCIQYDENNDCHLCKEGFFLSENQCNEKCSGTIMKQEIKKNQEKFYIDKQLQCFSTIDNCRVMSQNISSINIEKTCSVCQFGFLSIPNQHITNNQNDDPKITHITSPINQYNGLDCLSIEGKQILGKVNPEFGFIENCQYYYLLDESNKYGCLKCKLGFNGVISQETGLKGYIESCQEDIKCDKTINFEGINPIFQKFLSCQKCLGENEIPFFTTMSNDMKKFDQIKPFDIQGTVWTEKQGSQSNLCLQPLASSFGIENNQFFFPENCQIGGFNVGSQKINLADKTQEQGGDLQKISVFCIACKPKFKPVYFNQESQIIVKCQLIENCENSEWLNQCQNCKSNFIHTYDKQKGINYQECVDMGKITNCQILNKETNQCYFCKNGFFNNFDNQCEELVPAFCLDQKQSYFHEMNLNSINYLMSLQDQYNGCKQCEEGYFSKRIQQKIQTCQKSNYMEKQEFIENTNYIRFCQNYGLVENNMKCLQCQIGFVLNNNLNKCYPNTELQNCQKAIEENKCNQCMENYIVVNYRCILKSLEYCQKYDHNPSNNQQKCILCSAGYYLKDSYCHEGIIPGCQKYENEKKNKCLECKEKHYLIQNENSSYCFPIQADQNCKKLSKKFEEGFLECEQCEEKYYIDSTNIVQESLCLGLHQILHCEEYEKQQIDNQYHCKKCTKGYYSSDFKCQQRKYLNQESVKTYNLLKDQALECQEKYFLDFDGKCKPNPNGKYGCVRYSDQQTCIGCKPQHYLKDEKCISLTQEQRIDFCLYYQNPNQCLGCEDGYYPNDGKCEKAQALDCNTYLSSRECSSCKPGYGLKVMGDVKSCVLVNKPNCLIFSNYFPWECIICQSNYFPNNKGDCQQLENIITDCIAYENQYQCKRCKQGLILSLDKKKCQLENQAFLDSKCVSYIKKKQPLCSKCKPGYYFEGNNCVACQQNDDNGCFQCDPHNKDICLLCKSGFYQNSEGKCKKQDIETNENTNNEKNQQLLKTMILMVVLIF